MNLLRQYGGEGADGVEVGEPCLLHALHALGVVSVGFLIRNELLR